MRAAATSPTATKVPATLPGELKNPLSLTPVAKFSCEAADPLVGVVVAGLELVLVVLSAVEDAVGRPLELVRAGLVLVLEAPLADSVWVTTTVTGAAVVGVALLVLVGAVVVGLVVLVELVVEVEVVTSAELTNCVPDA